MHCRPVGGMLPAAQKKSFKCTKPVIYCYFIENLPGLWILHICFENSVNQAFLDRLQAGATKQEQAAGTQDGGFQLKQEPQEDAVFALEDMHTNTKQDHGEPSLRFTTKLWLLQTDCTVRMFRVEYIRMIIIFEFCIMQTSWEKS